MTEKDLSQLGLLEEFSIMELEQRLEFEAWCNGNCDCTPTNNSCVDPNASCVPIDGACVSNGDCIAPIDVNGACI